MSFCIRSSMNIYHSMVCRSYNRPNRKEEMAQSTHDLFHNLNELSSLLELEAEADVLRELRGPLFGLLGILLGSRLEH
jgi:hypothetical protein